jgi:2-polyprenyl-3-methyl-5-hydroxy-6-metoxy-1,4-benzoquinol methylase
MISSNGASIVIKQNLGQLARRLGLRKTAPPSQGSERSAQWYDAYYARDGDHHQRYNQSFYYFLWVIIADRLRQAGIRRVFEIGCGSGQLAAVLFEQGIEHYIGLDFSPGAIAMARQNATKGRFMVGDARTTTLHAEVEHDVVICTEVLEHIEDDLAVLGRFSPGKRCLFSVPNFDHESHVRRFRSADAVVGRYGFLFQDLDVMTLTSPNTSPEESCLFFLADGVRNDRAIVRGGGEVRPRPADPLGVGDRPGEIEPAHREISASLVASEISKRSEGHRTSAWSMKWSSETAVASAQGGGSPVGSGAPCLAYEPDRERPSLITKIFSRHGTGTEHEERERDATWYDSHFSSDPEKYCQPYYYSPYYFLWSIIADRVRRDGIRRVLEIGCGPGRLCAYLRDQGLKEYIGLDFSARAIEFARLAAPDVPFVIGDARTATIYHEVNYDLLICTEVLEHVEEDLRIVANFRPGRRCIGSVPNFSDPSHVRYFRDAAEVTARYARFFQSFDVVTLKSASSPADRFFLFDGVRNDTRV